VLLAVLAGAIPYMAPAQALPAYTPLSGATYEEVLGRLMPGHDTFTKGARFAITIRFLPPFSPEGQIAITYSFNSKASINVIELSKPLHAILNRLVAETDKQDDIARHGVPSKGENEDDRHPRRPCTKVALRVLALRIGSVTERSQDALKLDGTGQVEVDGDATLYEVIYSDTRSRP